MIANDLNENAVIERLLTRGCVTAPELARERGLPKSTAVSVIQRMADRDVIRRGDDRPGKRGRPLATYYPLLPRPLIVCLIDGLTITAAEVNRDLSVGKIQTRSKPGDGDASGWVQEISTHIQAALTESKASEVVLSVKAVEIDGRTLTSSVIPRISEVIGGLVNEQLRIEVECAQWPLLLATYRELEEPAPDPMLLLHAADGVSAHCIVGGRVFRGGSGLAGELGHVIVDEHGPPCGCGRRGCLEACCSGPAICQRGHLGFGAGSCQCPSSGRASEGSSLGSDRTDLAKLAWRRRICPTDHGPGSRPIGLGPWFGGQSNRSTDGGNRRFRLSVSPSVD